MPTEIRYAMFFLIIYGVIGAAIAGASRDNELSLFKTALFILLVVPAASILTPLVAVIMLPAILRRMMRDVKND